MFLEKEEEARRMFCTSWLPSRNTMNGKYTATLRDEAWTKGKDEQDEKKNAKRRILINGARQERKISFTQFGTQSRDVLQENVFQEFSRLTIDRYLILVLRNVSEN